MIVPVSIYQKKKKSTQPQPYQTIHKHGKRMLETVSPSVMSRGTSSRAGTPKAHSPKHKPAHAIASAGRHCIGGARVWDLVFQKLLFSMRFHQSTCPQTSKMFWLRIYLVQVELQNIWAVRVLLLLLWAGFHKILLWWYYYYYYYYSFCHLTMCSAYSNHTIYPYTKRVTRIQWLRTWIILSSMRKYLTKLYQ